MKIIFVNFKDKNGWEGDLKTMAIGNDSLYEANESTEVNSVILANLIIKVCHASAC
jgi:hypothetical protein